MENKITLWETDHWIVALAEDQTYLGRGVIILKRDPCITLTDLHEEELVDLHRNVIRPYEFAVKKAFGAEMCNWACLMNLAYQNTPPNPHVHWHIWPRYRNPVEIDGEQFVDEKFGFHYTPSTSRVLSGELRKNIAEKIVSAKQSLSQ